MNTKKSPLEIMLEIWPAVAPHLPEELLNGFLSWRSGFNMMEIEATLHQK